ncbi:MAG: hypothetical protein IKW92_07905 [Firmicutes bacterium]|nr:hypothetical protein [Bacillota bacterium]
MNELNTTEKKGLIGKLYGGLNMSWPVVILYAVATAVLTTVFLLFPVFKDTSFERMGVHLEAWFFFAIIVMANCKKPVESALKTFVFFLVSQPLIYLFQVPFNTRGWGIFGYYKYWCMMTILTLPMAYIGWYITKKNWWSVLILAPVLAFLGVTAYECGSFCLRHPPRLLVAALFCVLQIVLYVLAFFPEGRKKLIGFAIPVAAAIIMVLAVPQVDMHATNFLPDDPVLTDEAVVEAEEGGIAEISITETGESSMIMIHAKQYGTMDFAIRDGDKVYLYTIEIYEDEGGHSQVLITQR